MTDTESALGIAAGAFMEWRDRVGSDDAESPAVRAIGQGLMAEYIAALAQFAAAAGAGSYLVEPARRISIALNDARHGFGNPFFQHETELSDLAHKRWGGRKAPSRLWMEGRAVGCAKYLIDGGIAVQRACALVARTFDLAGHRRRDGERLSGRTVRDWYDALTTPSEDRDGWARAEGIADLHRQNEALETVSRLLRRAAIEPQPVGPWFTEEMLGLAHTCAIDPPTATLRLGGM